MGDYIILDNSELLKFDDAKKYLDFMNSEYLKSSAQAQEMGIALDSILKATVQVPLINTDSAEIGVYQALEWEMMLANEVFRLISIGADPAMVQSMYDSFENSIDESSIKDNCRLLREQINSFDDKISKIQNEIGHIERAAEEYHVKESNLEREIKRCGIFQRAHKKELQQELAILRSQTVPNVPDELLSELKFFHFIRDGYQEVLDKNRNKLKGLCCEANKLDIKVADYIKKCTETVDKVINSVRGAGRRIKL